MKLKRVQESNGRYYYIRDLEERRASGKPKQKWIPLSRVDEGEAALHAALAALLGEPAERAGDLVTHLADFRKHHLPTLGSDTVRKEYGRMFDVIATAFEEFNAADVEPGDVEAFLSDNFAGKLNTAGKYKARLSTFFAWCVRNSRTGVKVNPCREIRLSRPPKQRGKMNAAVYWQLHGALPPMGRCFLELAFLTLQRPTEIRLLRESQINPPERPGYIHFLPTKTEESSGEEVYVPITPEIQASLDRARALRPQRKVELLDRRRDPFIIQTRAGDGYSKNGLYEIWRDACAATGTKGVTTRHIRPFAGAMAKKSGYTKEDVQLAYAHALMGTTEGYLDQHRERVSEVRLPLPERK